MRFTFYNIFFNLLNSLNYFLLFQPACLRREARICWNFGHPETTLFSNVQPQIITFTLHLLILILGVTMQSVVTEIRKVRVIILIELDCTSPDVFFQDIFFFSVDLSLSLSMSQSVILSVSVYLSVSVFS